MHHGALVDLPLAGEALSPRHERREPRRWWPLPAFGAWALAWGVCLLLQAQGAALAPALAAGTAAGACCALATTSRMRRLIVAGGFPVSVLAVLAAAALPAWAWLLPLALLALAYPVTAWRDAPLFPTPAGALQGIERAAPLPEGASVLDAGCGLGHGLEALRRAYPAARIAGTEWSWPLVLAARLRCRWARVRRGDLWRDDWRGHDLVYLFQRPESLPRAVAKARAELAPGAWLASLEFEARELRPQAVLQGADGRPVWLYRAPFVPQATPPVDSPMRGRSSSRRRRR